ncbi:MAG: DUF4143 domain-containing protein [Gallicola sp.]|nr:DUF4143 domain-containing protein [Gallicola sp.]
MAQIPFAGKSSEDSTHNKAITHIRKHNFHKLIVLKKRMILICHNTSNPQVSFSQTKDLDSYKLYLADTGLFVTLLFIDRVVTENDIYQKRLSDKLPANLGYLYENAIAQYIQASGRELYYHTWPKENSTHHYEIDFLFSDGKKVSAIEVKSSGIGKHESLLNFREKFSKHVKNTYLLSQKDRHWRAAI